MGCVAPLIKRIYAAAQRLGTPFAGQASRILFADNHAMRPQFDNFGEFFRTQKSINMFQFASFTRRTEAMSNFTEDERPKIIYRCANLEGYDISMFSRAKEHEVLVLPPAYFSVSSEPDFFTFHEKQKIVHVDIRYHFARSHSGDFLHGSSPQQSLGRGGDSSTTAPTLLTPSTLFDAAEMNDVLTLRLLVARPGDHHDVNGVNAQGWTPMHIAARSGARDTIEALAQLGGSVNAKSDDGTTPLHRAAGRHQSDTVACLLKVGADVDSVDASGVTALMMAVGKGCQQCAEVLLKAGANVSRQDLRGVTALMRAASRGWVEVLGMLLAEHNSTHINLADCDGNTALHHAAMNHRALAVRELLTAGASHNAVNKTGHAVDMNGVVTQLLYDKSQIQVGKRIGTSTSEAVIATTGKHVVARFLEGATAGEHCIRELLFTLPSLKHPNIISVVGWSEATSPHECYVLSEQLVDCSTLLSTSERLRHVLPSAEFVAQILEWCIQIAQGLEYLHQHHVLHLDMRLSKVLHCYNRGAVLSDFGLAQARQIRLHKGIRHLAPEVLLKGAVHHAADLYGLGSLICELVFGGAGRQRDDEDHHDIFVNINKGVTPDVIHLQWPTCCSPDLPTLTQRLMSFNPVARASVAQTIQELKKLFHDARLRCRSKRIGFDNGDKISSLPSGWLRDVNACPSLLDAVMMLRSCRVVLNRPDLDVVLLSSELHEASLRKYYNSAEFFVLNRFPEYRTRPQDFEDACAIALFTSDTPIRKLLNAHLSFLGSSPSDLGRSVAPLIKRVFAAILRLGRACRGRAKIIVPNPNDEIFGRFCGATSQVEASKRSLPFSFLEFVRLRPLLSHQRSAAGDYDGVSPASFFAESVEWYDLETFCVAETDRMIGLPPLLFSYGGRTAAAPAIGEVELRYDCEKSRAARYLHITNAAAVSQHQPQQQQLHGLPSLFDVVADDSKIGLTKVLIAHGGSPANMFNSEGLTPLHIAASHGASAPVRLLTTDAGMEPNVATAMVVIRRFITTWSR